MQLQQMDGSLLFRGMQVRLVIFDDTDQPQVHIAKACILALNVSWCFSPHLITIVIIVVIIVIVIIITITTAIFAVIVVVVTATPELTEILCVRIMCG